jgi:hypothetical protein
MITGIKSALSCASDENKKEIGARAAAWMSTIAIDYYHYIKNAVTPYLADQRSWHEYLRQCWLILSAFEQAHELLPENEQIIGKILYVCNDNLQKKGVPYKNPHTRQTNFRPLLAEEKVKFQATKEHYSRLLNSFDSNLIGSAEGEKIAFTSASSKGFMLFFGVLIGQCLYKHIQCRPTEIEFRISYSSRK